MASSTATAWTPGQHALRDLIMLALDRLENRTLREEGGFVSVPLLELCGLDDTGSRRETVNIVLRKLEAEKTVTLDTRDRSKRIFGVVMTEELSSGRRLEIQKKRIQLQKASTPEGGELSEIEQLKVDCATAYTAILTVTAAQRAAEPGGLVKLSAAAALRTVGIYDQRGREVRHYLRLLRLAQSIQDCGDGSQLWWWDVREAELDLDQIEALATGKNAYGARRDKKRGKDNHTSLNGPVVVTHRNDAKPEPVATTPATAPTEPVTRTVATPATVRKVVETTDPKTAFLAYVSSLEAENLALRNQLAELGRAHAGCEEIARAHAGCGEINSHVRGLVEAVAALQNGKD